ncbi:hypothetical protein [Longispora urticae]
MTPSWHAPVNEILYVLITAPGLADPAPAQLAEAIVERRMLADGPAVYLPAVLQALAQSEPITTGSENPHSEEAVRDFLRRLVTQLEALRPWPNS